MPDAVLARYLARYAEPEAKLALDLSIESYDRCLVIPAFQESLIDIEAVTMRITTRFLLIIIVNASEHDSATIELLEQLRSHGKFCAQSGHLSYIEDGQRGLLIVDRCSEGRRIPLRQGVGLARKIGADIACALMQADRLPSGLIHMTDADVQLPNDYFVPEIEKPDTAAFVYPFEHQPEAPPDSQAALLYEISLLYYATALEYAGSPYAWPTIGSTLAVNARHYAMVRGFPKRNAAEDFYLLNKLAKTGRICQLEGPIVTISARPSARVPFGTGPAITRISSLNDPLSTYHYYHPEIFSHLKALLEQLQHAWDRFDGQALAEPARAAIETAGLASFLSDARRRTRGQAAFDKAVIDWFDAFRTLKFVHYLRDNYLPSVPLRDVVGSPLLPADRAEDLSLEEIRAMLAARCFKPTC